MDWILPNLAVGTHEEACDPSLVAWAGLRHALILTDRLLDEDNLALPGDVCQLVVRDGCSVRPDLFEDGLAFVADRHGLEEPVMIACGQGRSRSVTFAIAYVMRQGRTLEEAYRFVVSRRVNAVPHPELLKSLAAYHRVDLDLRACMRDLASIRHAQRGDRTALETKEV